MPFKEAAKSIQVTAPRDFPSSELFISPIASTKQCEPARPAIGPSAHHAWRQPTLNHSRVLLADDHPAMLKAESDLLSPYFDVVGTAEDGAALVSEARRLNPEVIVTDISMPILNGIDAVYKLRESGSTAKFVIVTVHSEGEFVEACMKAGALGYVQKLCLNHDLVPAIRVVLAGRSYISQLDSLPSRKHTG